MAASQCIIWNICNLPHNYNSGEFMTATEIELRKKVQELEIRIQDRANKQHLIDSIATKLSKYQIKKIAALEEANEYLHELREVFVIKEIFEMAAESGCQMFNIAHIYQPLKKDKTRYIWEATYIRMDQHFRVKGPTLEELEANILKKFGKDKIVEKEEDEDFL